MQEFQNSFIELAIEYGVLSFGEYKLKSGRKSPYFFNAGRFNTGRALAALGRYYAAAIIDSGVQFDMLFGPAYKGIPLVAATASALSDSYKIDVPYAFNRKEAKDHGEGGSVVGAPLAGSVLVVDDVITAGTAIREVANLITTSGAVLSGVVIGLNRQERGTGELSAVQQVQRELGIPVISIVQLDHVIQFLENDLSIVDKKMLDEIKSYRIQYGV